jgi:glycosyltransferase involved in cell wall biosynthesis
VLLLLLPDTAKGRSCIPSKVFNYILTGKPVLALVPDGDAADVIRNTKTGVVIDPRDRAAVKAALRQLLEGHGKSLPRPAPERAEIRRYDRRILTKELAGVLHAVTGERRSAGARSACDTCVD